MSGIIRLDTKEPFVLSYKEEARQFILEKRLSGELIENFSKNFLPHPNPDYRIEIEPETDNIIYTFPEAAQILPFSHVDKTPSQQALLAGMATCLLKNMTVADTTNLLSLSPGYLVCVSQDNTLRLVPLQLKVSQSYQKAISTYIMNLTMLMAATYDLLWASPETFVSRSPSQLSQQYYQLGMTLLLHCVGEKKIFKALTDQENPTMFQLITSMVEGDMLLKLKPLLDESIPLEKLFYATLDPDPIKRLEKVQILVKEMDQGLPNGNLQDLLPPPVESVKLTCDVGCQCDLITLQYEIKQAGAEDDTVQEAPQTVPSAARLQAS